MSEAKITLAEQMSAVEMSALAIRDLLERVADGKLKRPQEWIEVRERRLAALREAYRTLKSVEKEAAA